MEGARENLQFLLIFLVRLSFFFFFFFCSSSLLYISFSSDAPHVFSRHLTIILSFECVRCRYSKCILWAIFIVKLIALDKLFSRHTHIHSSEHTVLDRCICFICIIKMFYFTDPFFFFFFFLFFFFSKMFCVYAHTLLLFAHLRHVIQCTQWTLIFCFHSYFFFSSIYYYIFFSFHPCYAVNVHVYSFKKWNYPKPQKKEQFNKALNWFEVQTFQTIWMGYFIENVYSFFFAIATVSTIFWMTQRPKKSSSFKLSVIMILHYIAH